MASSPQASRELRVSPGPIASRAAPRSPWSRIAPALIGLLAPVLCIGCAREIGDGGRSLCDGCLAALERLPAGCCRGCAQPQPCLPCPAAAASWACAHSACAHRGTARSMVSSLKRSGSARVSNSMALEIVGVLPPEVLESSAIVPVAPHPARRRRSGVDHSRRLAAALARLTGRPMLEPLSRVGRATRQAGASRSARTEPGRITLEVVAAVPQRVVLVDDVHTTGATLNAAASALLAAGCESVSCASFARAVRDPVHLPKPPDW